MAGARLAALRLVGFKSFAEKTTVEFGPGISAVVGPNGSGKSNLADALRWTLGEQGRSLRTRRSEDVIFAGSSSRRAIGMADVTLVIDNQDGLLPVDYAEVEIGRRLYRSGESEYLLNRQRIRLRDLVDLLDAGNLADNAFLFIGQGMVDQALALRPEERRPLFEEAAGVRRHERRRRHAEAELAEAEANLDRMRDVLAELRPQARRLSAQAEQLEARRTAGSELAEGLLSAARGRWQTASVSARQEQKDVDRARAAADRALAELKAAEEESGSLSLAIGRRADAERSQRDSLDRLRGELTESRIRAAGIDSEVAALSREAERLSAERSTIEQRQAEAARMTTTPIAELPAALETELSMLERELTEIETTAVPPDDAREMRARSAELERHATQRDAAVAAAAQAAQRLANLEIRLAVAEKERNAAVAAARSAEEKLAAAESAVNDSRRLADESVGARSTAQARVAEADAEASAARARLAAIDAALAGSDDGLARAARARGGKLVGEGLEIDPDLRNAVAAALGPAARAHLVTADVVPALAGRRGVLVVPVARRRARAASAADEALIEAARRGGGGALVNAVRRDPQGEVSRLLERVVWVADLTAALDLRDQLLPGGCVVTLAGDVVGEDGVIALASADPVLELRAERETIARELEALDQHVTDTRRALDAAHQAAQDAAASLQAATQSRDGARGDRRRAEDAERIAQRHAEQLLRETTWERARDARLAAESEAAEALVVQQAADVERLRAAAPMASGEQERAAQRQLRRDELLARRDELRRTRDRGLAEIAAADEARRRAEVRQTMDAARMTDLEAEAARLAERTATLRADRDKLAVSIAATDDDVRRTAAELEALLHAGADERSRLIAAERAAADARNRLRDAEQAARTAEMHSMEARLQLEQTREQLLVELATIGADGMAALRAASGEAAIADEENAAERMEDLLDHVVDLWRVETPGDEQQTPPSASRLASLRRRFNELGAGNPFAVEEYAEVRERLENLDAQRSDMESAIASTRELIASLSALINEQFRTTFAALEDAFERRFHELFGGGDAELSLTVPEDISTTGIEIHARPPGKKRQPLSMLSGGERALTAVSLLLAMLEVRPVPFCVLDEVDAALDEANVGRFSKALRGLAEQTQFIVITHNRGTIEGADALYGVTLGDDAVSRVVSLRLPEPDVNGRATEEPVAEAALP